MDSITQALLGASVQASLLGRWQGRKALLYGAMLGTLPDLDVVINYGDAVANMTYHRGFSHSLFVLSLVAVVLTWLARRIRPHPDYSAMRLFLTLWLVLITHVTLDAFTSYGTQLFWPLQTTPVAWSSVFIIDPLYSVPLLLGVLDGFALGFLEPLPNLVEPVLEELPGVKLCHITRIHRQMDLRRYLQPVYTRNPAIPPILNGPPKSTHG